MYGFSGRQGLVLSSPPGEKKPILQILSVVEIRCFDIGMQNLRKTGYLLPYVIEHFYIATGTFRIDQAVDFFKLFLRPLQKGNSFRQGSAGGLTVELLKPRKSTGPFDLRPGHSGNYIDLK